MGPVSTYLDCMVCDYGVHGCIMVCDHKGWAAHTLGLVCQQVAALRVSIICNNNACIGQAFGVRPSIEEGFKRQ